MAELIKEIEDRVYELTIQGIVPEVLLVDEEHFNAIIEFSMAQPVVQYTGQEVKPHSFVVAGNKFRIVRDDNCGGMALMGRKHNTRTFDVRYIFQHNTTGAISSRLMPIDQIEGSFDVFNYCKDNNVTLTDRICTNSSQS